MNVALQYFEENLPHRPYHTDDLAFGLRISGKGRALLARYIQQNQPHAQFWLVFDVDREGAAIDWSDRNAPAPNITVKNPVNGHAHLLYALNIAVRTAPDSSVKALKYAAAIERSLCEKLCADVNYSGLICKNPFHLEWQVMEWREEAYTLDELADYLDLSASARRSIDKHYGMGRNCHLFEMTAITFAYELGLRRSLARWKANEKLHPKVAKTNTTSFRRAFGILPCRCDTFQNNEYH